MNQNVLKAFYLVAAVLCFTPYLNSASALVLGVTLTLIFGNPFLAFLKQNSRSLLAYSVVGLGFGMNLGVVAKVGLQGVAYTVIGIALTFNFGLLFGKILKTSADCTLLITVGTAICGGSAIAAVSPTIHAKQEDISVALATVFLLNALALLVFPVIGHALSLNESQFGLWCALAIHDTSSVVGASMQFGTEALQIATTVKLARALWIIPVALITGFIYARKNPQLQKAKASRPWFILGFVLAAAVVTAFPNLQATGHQIEAVAKRLLVLSLFCIGACLTRATLKAVGFRPLILGVVLWLVVASATLSAIYEGIIHT